MEMNVSKKADRGAYISIIAYIILSIIKLGVGYWANSEALMADGLNNTTDILASIAVLFGLKISRKPRDLDHTYGHSRVEHIASLIASFIMAMVGFQVLFNAISRVYQGKTEPPELIAAVTGVFAAIVMYFVYRYNNKLAKEVNSSALYAAAKDNLSDALVSIGAVIGIVGSQFGLPWLDPIVAVIVGIIILKTAWDIFRDATHTLTDGYDPEKIHAYTETINEVEGVEGIADVRARSQGTYTLVDATILANPLLSLIEAHEISDRVEKLLKEKHGIHSIIHVEPID